VSGAQGWSVEGFHHVQLGMPPGGEPEAEAFYSELLRFVRIEKPAHLASRGGCWFRSGAVELHLGVETGFAASSKAHPALRVRGLASVRAAFETADWPVQDDAQLGGHERWYALDPFGNRLEFIAEG
jgi:catechol 2,3-dioxygenase-like lactoylglutathione lyase family enzyme